MDEVMKEMIDLEFLYYYFFYPLFKFTFNIAIKWSYNESLISEIVDFIKI